MVRALLIGWLLTAVVAAASPLYDSVESLIGAEAFSRNEPFIRIVFSPEEAYLYEGRVDIAKVAEKLREHGLLKLSFPSPRWLELTFEAEGTPQLFMALMNDTLHEMGYLHYLTESAIQTDGGFTWTIRMETESATDPALLQRELRKRGCTIADAERLRDTQWHYRIDMHDARLKALRPEIGTEETYKRLVYPHWLDVSGADKLTLWSLKGNNWYPYVAFYDDALRLLKLYKRDKRSWQITLRLPRGCTYVKIADLYSRKNMKEGLRVLAE